MSEATLRWPYIWIPERFMRGLGGMTGMVSGGMDSTEASFGPMGSSGPSTTNLVGWYKADVGVYSDAGTTPAINGGTVQQWNDQSGNGHHLTQSGAPNRPVYRTAQKNGLPIVDTSGTSIYMDVSFTWSTPGHVFAVINSRSINDLAEWMGAPAATQSHLEIFPRLGKCACFCTPGQINGTNSAVANNTWYIISIDINGASSYINVNNGTRSTGTLTTQSVGGFSISISSNTQNLYTGEVLVYNASLSDPTEASIYSYLSTRWAI